MAPRVHTVLRTVLGAFAATALVANLAIWLAGAQPAHVWGLVLAGTVGNPYGLGQTLAKATPLVLTGASVALALRAGLFNIGAEGQLTAGILVAAIIGAHLPSDTPFFLAVPAVTLCSALAGAALGATAGWLRGRFGAHEVITTLMLNGLITVIATNLYGGVLRTGAQVHTRPVIAAARVPHLDTLIPTMRGSALSAAVVLAAAVPFAAEWYVRHTARGLRIRALGANPEAARALGIHTTVTSTWAMALAGALAALGAVHYVLGAKGYAEQGMGAGTGFTGIAVAMLGRGSPIGIVVSALLFGALAQGGLVVNAVVPADTLALVQAIVLFAVAAVAGRLGAAGPRAQP